MKCHELLSKSVRSTALSVVFSLLAVVYLSIHSLAQLDPRERYGTYLGGTTSYVFDQDFGESHPPASTATTAATVDSAGNIYVSGATSATDFPTTSGAYRRVANISFDDFNGKHSDDSFVAKFDSAGKLVWSTYLGIQTGIRGDQPSGGGIRTVALDGTGNVFVTGTVLQGGFGRYPQITPFLMKLNSTGSAVLFYRVLVGRDPSGEWCGNLGSSGTAEALALDAAGFAYVTGSDPYNCVTPTPGANQTGASFVMKVNTAKAPTASTVYASKLGEVDWQTMRAISVDNNGNAYATGDRGRVYTLNSVGAITFFTEIYSEDCVGRAIKVTGAGQITVSGTCASYIPATADFGNDYSGPVTFITRFGGGGVPFTAAVHDSNLIPLGMVLNSAGEAFLTGQLKATSFRVNAYLNAPLSGAFLLRLNRTGTALMLYSAFGGNTGYAVAIDKAWNAFVVGASNKGVYFPITTNAYQSVFRGAISGFLEKLIIEADLGLTTTATPNPVVHGANLTYTLAVYNRGPDVSDGDTVTDVLPAGTTFVSFSTTNGTCTHPAVGSGGTFKCTRTSPLLKAHYWGPIKLTVHVNAASGTTLTNKASVAAKTQDVNSSNNTTTISVKVQ